MKKLNLNIALFLLTIFSFGILNIFNPTKSGISELENRTLHERPSFTMQKLFSGQYFKEYEDYYSDNFVFRSMFINVSSALNHLRGLENSSGTSIVRHSNTFESPASPNTIDEVSIKKDNKSNQDLISNENIKSPGEKVEWNVLGDMLVANDAAMNIYHFSNKDTNYYINVLNKYQYRLGSSAKIYSLLIPTQIEFLQDSKIKKISTSQKGTIDFINQGLDKNITAVDTFTTLSQNTDKYIYFRTDHHWTSLGAYFAYTAFAKAIGQIPVPIKRYEETKVKDFLGSTYSGTLNKKLKNNLDTIFIYKPYVKHEYYIYYEGPLKMDLLDMHHASKQNKYRIFLSGDRPLGKIVTEIENGRKVAVIKDSFGNAFVPFLLPHYQEIYIIDPRQFKQNILKLIKDKGIQDVLFINYVPAAAMQDFTKLIEDMMNY